MTDEIDRNDRIVEWIRTWVEAEYADDIANE